MADTFRTTQDSSSLQIENYVTVSVACLLVYEHALTYDREVKLFWRRSVTGSSILFFINRYLPLVVNLINMRYLHPSTDNGNSCATLSLTHGILEYVQYIPWAFLSALRVYALSFNSWSKWPLSILIFLSSLVPMVINFIELSHSSIVVDSAIVRCIFTVDMSREIENYCIVSLSHQSDAIATEAYLVTIISRLCLVAADLMVMGITWKATYKTSREVVSCGRRSSLSSILLRDGAIYFITLAIMNILHLSFSLSSILGTLASSNSLIVIFNEAFTAILISRFLMDLQGATDAAMHQHSGVSSLSSLNFNTVLGALGSSLSAPMPNSEEDSYPPSLEGRIEFNDIDTRFTVYDDVAYESRISGLEGGAFYVL